MAITDLDHAGQQAVAEVNQRIGTNRIRKPFTTEDFESYRPKPAAATPVADDALPSESELARLLGLLAGPWAEPKQKLAHYITLLEQRIAALELANVAAK